MYLCETWYFHSFICETNARECHGMKWNGAEKMLPQMTQAQRREMFKHNKIEEKLVFFFLLRAVVFCFYTFASCAWYIIAFITISAQYNCLCSAIQYQNTYQHKKKENKTDANWDNDVYKIYKVVQDSHTILLKTMMEKKKTRVTEQHERYKNKAETKKNNCKRKYKYSTLTVMIIFLFLWPVRNNERLRGRWCHNESAKRISLFLSGSVSISVSAPVSVSGSTIVR